MGSSELIQHALDPSHLAGGITLGIEANWNQTADDWRLFFEHGVGWGYSTQSDQSTQFTQSNNASTTTARLVATTIVIPYDIKFAWVSVVLVAADFRRHGLATRLMQRALQYCAAIDRIPILDATPAGREVYLRMGFTDAWWLERLIRPVTSAKKSDPVAVVAVRAIRKNDWPGLLAYDRAVFGADRAPWLRALAKRWPAAAKIATARGAVVGYSLGRDGRLASQIGPVMADTPFIAQALLCEVLRAVSGAVCIDLPKSQIGLRAWLMMQGFALGRPFSRMIRGANDTFDDHERLIASAGPEIG